MKNTKLFQASTKLEAPLISKRGGQVIRILIVDLGNFDANAEKTTRVTKL